MGKVINGETTDVNVMYTSLLISYFIFCFGFKVFEEKNEEKKKINRCCSTGKGENSHEDR